MVEHRNSQKRVYEENTIYFVTIKTFQNFPYFKEKIFCDLWIEELKLTKRLKKFELYAFCLNYDHSHLLLKPNKEFNISKVMKSLKENFSRDANYIIENYYYEGDTSTYRLRMRNWIRQFQTQFIQKYGPNQHLAPKFKWQKSFHDYIIRNQNDFEKHYNYAIYNFQKHGLPDDWKYTSLNFVNLIDEIEI